MRAIVAAALLVCLTAAADTDDDWLDGPSAAEVNGGELTFLAERPAGRAHRHANRITIHESSLADGWVGLDQCHAELDPVSAAQIVYGEGRIRALAITAHEGIGEVRVDGHTVQLKDVGRDARLCIRAESRALHALGDQVWELRNGPYMRRFLDGFYPMHVVMDVRIAAPGLRFLALDPPVQPGLALDLADDRLRLDAWFAGRLVTRMRFARAASP
jgi:hypothetical protein